MEPMYDVYGKPIRILEHSGYAMALGTPGVPQVPYPPHLSANAAPCQGGKRQNIYILFGMNI